MSNSEALDDFLLEAAAFRDLVAPLDEPQWELVTPAEPWRVRDQVAHLSFVLTLAATAASDPERFAAMTAPAAEVGFDAAVNHALGAFNTGGPAEVLDRFDTAVAAADAALRPHAPDDVVPWLVNPLPVAVLTAAGMCGLARSPTWGDPSATAPPSSSSATTASVRCSAPASPPARRG